MESKLDDINFTFFIAPLVVYLIIGLCACSTTDVEPPPDSPSTEAASLPLLDSGFTLGMTLYGGADLPASDTAERALLDTAVERGLNGFTYYVDWGDLEPEPGRYTLAEFRAKLDDLRRFGVLPFVNITVGDIEEYNLPSGLSDGKGGLAENVTLNDPAVIERFGRLLDRVVPILVDNGGFILGVGNEVDARFDGPYSDELTAYVQFVEAARERVHSTYPELAVGVTLTSYAVRNQSETFRAIREVTDVLPLNYAPIDANFFVRDQEQIIPDFKEVLSAYRDKPILIQELTCPSAPSMDASEEWQRTCFEQLFTEISKTPQVRFASVFTFQDFDEQMCSLVRDLIFGEELDNLPEEVAERLSEYLCKLGVVKPDGTPKLAWDTILEMAEVLTE